VWQSRAHIRRRSCGANLSVPACAAYSRTTCHKDFSVSLSPQVLPILCTRRNNWPDVMFAVGSHWLRTLFTHAGIGMVRIWPAFPFSASERSRWRGGRCRVPDAGGIGDSMVASLKNDRSRVTMRRIVDRGVMDRSMIINNYPFGEFRFWQGFPGENRLKFHR